MLRHPVCRRPVAAFTLIELLVVVAILGIVTGVVGASLAAGIRAWQLARTFGTAEAQSLVGMRIFRRDLMNTFTFYAVPFEGSHDAVAFPALVDIRSTSDTPALRLGSIAYRWNRYQKTLEREVSVFASDEVTAASPERLVQGVEALVIRYGELGEGGVTWEESWDNATNHPELVEIELTIATDREPFVVRETIVAAVPTIQEKK